MVVPGPRDDEVNSRFEEEAEVENDLDNGLLCEGGGGNGNAIPPGGTEC